MTSSRIRSWWPCTVWAGLLILAIQPVYSDEPKTDAPPAPTTGLTQVIEVTFDNASLEACVKQIAEKAGVAITWEEGIDDKIKQEPITAHARGLRASAILNDLLGRHDLTTRIEKESVIVTQMTTSPPVATPPAANPAINPQDEFLPRPTEAEQKILTALIEPTTVEFVETPLGEALQTLREMHSVNLVVDGTALTEEKRKAPVTLNLKEARLRSVLQALLRDAGLTYVVEDDALRITTPIAAAEEYSIRTYPVADLVGSPETAKSLAQSLEKAVDVSSWERLGGRGNIVTANGAKNLVITQTWHGHQKVLELLRILRKSKDAP